MLDKNECCDAIRNIKTYLSPQFLKIVCPSIISRKKFKFQKSNQIKWKSQFDYYDDSSCSRPPVCIAFKIHTSQQTATCRSIWLKCEIYSYDHCQSWKWCHSSNLLNDFFYLPLLLLWLKSTVLIVMCAML